MTKAIALLTGLIIIGYAIIAISGSKVAVEKVSDAANSRNTQLNILLSQ